MKKVIKYCLMLIIASIFLNMNIYESYALNKISVLDATVQSIPAAKYTGKQIKPSVVIKYKNKTLKKGTDYQVIYGSNKLPGKGKLKITGKGNYVGSRYVYFTIKDINHIKYSSHIQGKGWKSYVTDGKTSGTTGKNLVLDGIRLKLVNQPYKGSIVYRTYLSKKGWQEWKYNGVVSGSIKPSSSIEAIRIKMLGDMSKNYDIYYRSHVQNIGWTNWTKNGNNSGSLGYGYHVEAIEVKMVKRGSNAVKGTGKAFYEKKQPVKNCSHQYVKKMKTMVIPEQGHYQKRKIGVKNNYQMTGVNDIKIGMVIKPMLKKDEEGILYEIESQSNIDGLKRYMKDNNCIGWKQVEFKKYYDDQGWIHTEWAEVPNTYHASKVISKENIYKDFWIVDKEEHKEQVIKQYVCKKCGQVKKDVEYKEITYDLVDQSVYSCNMCGYPLYTISNHKAELLDEMYFHPNKNGCEGGAYHSETFYRGYCALCGDPVMFKQCPWKYYRTRCCNDTTVATPVKVKYDDSVTGWAYYKYCSCGKNQITLNEKGEAVVYAGLK